ncbi:methylated-DNA--[protein]-cysteine S-methyltransferase [Kangiella marina]|uniref:Methylated-DNA--protein-cysteine methyltransferase n=1 Tax=Kangiella marina TaxID=1079178 RepID=A0ABP8IMZ4_9GAMM
MTLDYQPIYYQKVDCPFGAAHLYATNTHLKALLFKPWGKVLDSELTHQSNAILENTRSQLAEYFQGQRTCFDIPLQSTGTDFQQKVWRILTTIPFGQTWNYGQLAQAIGNKNASRAVGAANGKNPISIIVPCHRVIGANGTLTGYAGGLAAKEWLLKHEGVL